jgi:hypothetical protein
MLGAVDLGIADDGERACRRRAEEGADGAPAEPPAGRGVKSNSVSVIFRGAALALTILFFVGGDGNARSAATQGPASSAGPFGQIAGSWSGSGTIDLFNGRHEPIKCRVSSRSSSRSAAEARRRGAGAIPPLRAKTR